MAKVRGEIRDAIVDYLGFLREDASIAQIVEAVSASLGGVAASSVRSSLNLHVNSLFERTGMGRYRLRRESEGNVSHVALSPAIFVDKAH
jgi:hypothetical protein